MPVVRVYLPVGGADLEGLAQTGELPADPGSPRVAFAVTPALAAGAPGLDQEDLEYAAFVDAVGAAAAVRSAPGDRRVVAAADADPAWVVSSEDRPVSRVAIVAPVPAARIASFHVDEHRGVAGGAPGPESRAASSSDEADDLLWYDVTELDEVRALLS